MSELIGILSHEPGLASVVIGVSIGLSAVARIICVWIREKEKTRRLNIVLLNSEPSERAKILAAYPRAGQTGTGTNELGR